MAVTALDIKSTFKKGGGIMSLMTVSFNQENKSFPRNTLNLLINHCLELCLMAISCYREGWKTEYFTFLASTVGASSGIRER